MRSKEQNMGCFVLLAMMIIVCSFADTIACTMLCTQALQVILTGVSEAPCMSRIVYINFNAYDEE